MKEGGEGELRQRALANLRKKREFASHLVAYVLVNAFLVVMWAFTGAGFFWPVFPLFAWGIGLAFPGTCIEGSRPRNGSNGRAPRRPGLRRGCGLDKRLWGVVPEPG